MWHTYSNKTIWNRKRNSIYNEGNSICTFKIYLQKLTIPTVNFSVLTFQELDFINIHTIVWVVLIYLPDTFTSVWLKMQFPVPHMKLNGILHKSQACKTWAKHQQTGSQNQLKRRGRSQAKARSFLPLYFYHDYRFSTILCRNLSNIRGKTGQLFFFWQFVGKLSAVQRMHAQ